MGTAYTAIPGLGPMPSPLSRDWLLWKDALISYRLGEIPLSSSTNYYFSQSEGNDATGDGSQVNPWQTIAKAQAIHDASSGDIAFHFAKGNEWTETTGFAISKPNCRVLSYDLDSPPADNHKPHFNRFVNQYLAGWTLSAGTTYSRIEALTIEWVRYRDDPLGTVFYRAASSAEVLAGAILPCFYYDSGATRLWINIGSDVNVVGIEAVDRNSSSYGIRINNGASNCRVDGMWCDGWGMDATSVGSNIVGIADSLRGTDTALITDCWSFYSGSHTMVHVTSGPGNGGGISTYHNCEAGLCMYNGASYETIFNTYSNDGAQETIFTECTARWGTLPSSDWYSPSAETRRGRVVYGHTAGVIASNLCIADRVTTPSTAYSAVLSSQFANNQTASDIANCRSFIYGEELAPDDLVGFSPSGGSHCFINCYLKARRNNETAQAMTASRPVYVYYLNCVFDVDADLQTTSPFGFYNSTSTDNLIYFYHCHIKLINCDVTWAIDRDTYTGGTNSSPNSKMINCIVDYQGAGTKYVGLNNVAANQRYNAYFGVATQTDVRGYSNDPSPVVLTATVAPLFSSGGKVMTLYSRGDPALDLTYDYYGKARASLPTIGPVEIRDGSSFRQNRRPWRGRV